MKRSLKMRESIPFMYANSISAELMKSGDLDTAEHICLQALETKNVLFLGNPRTSKKVVAMNNGMLGNVYMLRNNFTEAEKYYEKALKLFLELDSHSEGIGITYSNLGAIYELMGNLSEAMRCWTEARFVFSVIGDEWRSKLTDEWIKEIEDRL